MPPLLLLLLVALAQAMQGCQQPHLHPPHPRRHPPQQQQQWVSQVWTLLPETA